VHLFASAAVDALPAETVTQRLDAPGPHRVAGINGLVSHEPSGRQAFSALGDLWLADGDELTRLTDDAAVDAWPAFSPDGDWLVFASDRGGRMQLWRVQLATGQLLQLTDGPGRAFLPRYSGDGRYVAFLETSGLGPWDEAALQLVAIEQPFRTETLASGLFDAGDLSWQGARIRLLARAAGAAEALVRVFDAPAADTAVSPETGAAPALPAAAAAQSWEPLAADEAYVIRAARIFDGIRDDYTYLVDIHIEGQRIRDIVRRGRLPLPDRVIDVGELTIVPGLIDVHVHQSTLAGSAIGTEWLRHGVTTVREVMAVPDEALERAETWASGRQPGPRLVISPATPVMNLAASSPIVVSGGRIARGLSHGLAEQIARADESLAAVPPILAPTDSANTPGLTVSTLGRSYQDVISQLGATGAWLPTSLAAIDALAPAAGSGNLSSTIERVMRSSGRVAIGSDAPAVAYGAGYHDELALLEARNIPRAQILRWATAGGAIALGLSLELGTLEAGRLADLVIVDGDPLARLDDLKRIRTVVVGGVWRDIDSLGPGN
jgi:hypothetical protein